MQASSVKRMGVSDKESSVTNLVQLDGSRLVSTPIERKPISKDRSLQKFTSIPASEGYFALCSEVNDALSFVSVMQIDGIFYIRHDDGQRSSSLVKDQFLLGPYTRSTLELRTASPQAANYVPTVIDEVAELESTLFELESDKKALQKQYDTLLKKQSSNPLKTAVNKLKDELGAVSQSLSESQRAVKEKQGEIDECMVKITFLESRLKNDGDLQSVKDKLKQTQDRVKRTDKELAELKQRASPVATEFPDELLEVHRLLRALIVSATFAADDDTVKAELAGMARTLAKYI